MIWKIDHEISQNLFRMAMRYNILCISILKNLLAPSSSALSARSVYGLCYPWGTWFP